MYHQSTADNHNSYTSLVYVIDDDSAVRRSLSTILTAASIEHRCFERASDFLNQYEDVGPACIVTDVRMPEISGLQMLEQMEERGIEHPVIVTTGFSEVDTVIRAFRNGAVDVFEKPISGTLLLDRIQQAIQRDSKDRDRRKRAKELREKLEELSKRERQVMDLLMTGRSNKEIAWQLNLSDKTVAAHRAKMLNKLQFDSLTTMATSIVQLNLSSDIQSDAA
ncbi:MAG: response regulator [Phycisphaeraceae bacterium]|nr:response regulator [Phycisphaeraceae bacterium]